MFELSAAFFNCFRILSAELFSADYSSMQTVSVFIFFEPYTFHYLVEKGFFLRKLIHKFCTKIFSLQIFSQIILKSGFVSFCTLSLLSFHVQRSLCLTTRRSILRSD